MMTSEQKAAWLSQRCGKLTASRMTDAMARLRNGESAASRIKLLHELLAERLTGQSAPHVVTEAMEHGLMYEDEAVDEFVARYPQYRVRLSKFYEHPTIDNFGATPDRDINDDGHLEVKCPTTATYLGWVLAGVVPEQHKPQMTAQLLCSGKKWCGFIAYDPRVKDEKRRLFLRKYEPTEEERAQVLAAAVGFLDELENLFDQFVNAAA